MANFCFNCQRCQSFAIERPCNFTSILGKSNNPFLVAMVVSLASRFVRLTYEGQVIESKPISELAPATPGAAFIYGTVELPALEPAYVEHGRRPKDAPLAEP